MDEAVKEARGRPRNAAVDEAVLSAARQLLAEKGHAGFSMEAVAARAGVAKTSVYRRWPTKGDLFVDLYMEGMPAEPLKASGEQVSEAFRTYLYQTVKRLQNEEWRSILRSLVAEAQSNPKTAEALRERIIEVRRDAGRRLLAVGKQRKQVRTDLDEELFLDFLFGAVWYRILLGGGSVDRAFADRALDLAMRLAEPAKTATTPKRAATSTRARR
jgi:AcrR family transcriptional regulator